MPWKEYKVMDQKKEFVLESLKEDLNFSQLCAKYCISTKTGYKWKQRFLLRGFEGLEEFSRKPKTSPQKISEETVLELIRIKIKKKHWGSLKVQTIYSNLHPDKEPPARSSIDRIFKKAGLIKPKKRKRNTSGVRIENREVADHPNHIWTVDFKGWWYVSAPIAFCHFSPI